MDITSAVLSGVTRSQNFAATMAKKEDAIALLTSTLTQSGGSAGLDALSDAALQSNLLSAGGAAAIKLMVGQDPNLGQNVDVRA